MQNLTLSSSFFSCTRTWAALKQANGKKPAVSAHVNKKDVDALEKILYPAPGDLASKAPYNKGYTPPGYKWCGTPQSGFWSYQFKDDEINPGLSDT